MIFPSYKNDGIPSLDLNEVQRQAVAAVRQKIASGEYRFRELSLCPCCGGSDFENLAEKDRYGFANKNVLCTACGLVFSNPMWTDESVGDFYQNYYSLIYKGTTDFRSIAIKEGGRPARIFQYIKSYAHLDPKASVLEIGCDLGMNLYPFYKAGYKVKGIDLDDERIEFGKEYYQINLHTMPLEDESGIYNLIVLSHVLEHIIDLPHFLRHIKNRLAPEGLVYIEVPGVKKVLFSPEQPKDFYSFEHDIQNAHVYYFSLATLTNVMNQNGFELVEGDEVIQSLWRYTGIKNAPLHNDYPALRLTLTQINPLQKEIQALKREIDSLKTEGHNRGELQALGQCGDILNYSLYFCWCRFIYKRVRRPIFRHCLTGNLIGVLQAIRRHLKA